MISPARRHVVFTEAKTRTAQTGGFKGNAYEQMLVKLAADQRRLKKVQSMQIKAETKRQLLPEYLSWVSGVLAADSGVQDDVFITIMLWAFDAADTELALKLARYALKHNLAMPVGHHRKLACVVGEESADLQFRQFSADQPINLPFLLDMLELTKSEDMPDQVRANLHKIIGFGFRERDELTPALEHLKQAQALNDQAGCKKEIERLTKELNKLNA